MEFREEEAIKYGVNEAIMINNFRFWIQKNKANGKHEYDGRTWTYNSKKAFKDIFKFWSDEQIKRILKSLVDKNILQKGNYNKISFDRTIWYSFVDEDKFLYVGLNDPIHWVKSPNPLGENNQPIPDIYNTYNNTIYIKEKNINKKRKVFKKPTIEEIKNYCKERKNKIDAETFFDFYESKGWVVGKSSMKDWKAAVRTWERQRNNNKPKQQECSPIYQSYEDFMAEEAEKERLEQERIKLESSCSVEEGIIEGLEDW